MANNYLEFSQVIARLSRDEEDWLRGQLETVYVYDDREYTLDDVPEELALDDADWVGCRAYRDLPDCAESATDMGLEGPGFEYEFDDDHDPPDGWGRHLWVHSGEWGYVDGLAQLVRKFLKRFRPDQCWSLTYASTCSKPRVGEFGGGAVFVTAEAILGQDAHEFVDQQHLAFERTKESPQQESKHGETIATRP